MSLPCVVSEWHVGPNSVGYISHHVCIWHLLGITLASEKFPRRGITPRQLVWKKTKSAIPYSVDCLTIDSALSTRMWQSDRQANGRRHITAQYYTALCKHVAVVRSFWLTLKMADVRTIRFSLTMQRSHALSFSAFCDIHPLWSWFKSWFL